MNQEEQLAELVEEEAAPAAAEEEFQFATLPPEISFQTERVPPPAWLYVGPDDRMRLEVATAIAGVTLRLDVRLLLPKGEIKSSVWTFGPTGDRAINTWWVTLAEAFLLSVLVSTDSVVPPGACWVRCLLVRGGGGGASLAQAIVMGYLAQRSGLAWPYPRYQNPVEGAGRLRVIVGTDPAAGVQIFETVPAGARWRLLALRAELTTSMVVGDRHVLLTFNDGLTPWWNSNAIVAQPTNWLYAYTWAIGVNGRIGVPQGWIQDTLPDHITLAAGWQFYTQVMGWQAGDNWAAPVYYVEEWVEP